MKPPPFCRDPELLADFLLGFGADRSAFAFVFRPLGLQQQASVEADGDEAACVAELPGTQPLDAFRSRSPCQLWR
jgi:hypothetical protein